MRFELMVIHSHTDRTAIGGRNVPDESITIIDMGRVIEAERFLEKILGKRVHINQVPERSK